MTAKVPADVARILDTNTVAKMLRIVRGQAALEDVALVAGQVPRVDCDAVVVLLTPRPHEPPPPLLRTARTDAQIQKELHVLGQIMLVPKVNMSLFLARASMLRSRPVVDEHHGIDLSVRRVQ